MAKIALVTDSTSYIPVELVQRYQITVIPQVLIWGSETFLDGVDIQPSEFYTRLKTATVMPSTSQATVAAFVEIFQGLLDQGFEILAILVSEKISGTINSATQAKTLLPASATIEIVDSQTTAMALGFQVLSVARLLEMGASMPEARALAEKAVQHTGVVFTVDTLEFLHRGGRIGGGKRFLGTALKIKPILEMRDGLIEAVEQVRTRGKSLSRLVELIEAQIGGRTPVRLAALHANAEAEARSVLEEACARMKVDESLLSIVSPVVGTHAGPGTVGLAYMAGM
jgi:DegV family protein with EDD domain